MWLDARGCRVTPSGRNGTAPRRWAVDSSGSQGGRTCGLQQTRLGSRRCLLFWLFARSPARADDELPGSLPRNARIARPVPGGEARPTLTYLAGAGSTDAQVEELRRVSTNVRVLRASDRAAAMEKAAELDGVEPRFLSPELLAKATKLSWTHATSAGVDRFVGLQALERAAVDRRHQLPRRAWAGDRRSRDGHAALAHTSPARVPRGGAEQAVGDPEAQRRAASGCAARSHHARRGYRRHRQ